VPWPRSIFRLRLLRRNRRHPQRPGSQRHQASEEARPAKDLDPSLADRRRAARCYGRPP
jgi:hypothetical protein